MPKKKLAENMNPSLLRRGEKTTRELDQYSKQLGELKADLDAVIARMRKEKIAKLHMDGVTKIERALYTLADGVTYAETALGKARRSKS